MGQYWPGEQSQRHSAPKEPVLDRTDPSQSSPGSLAFRSTVVRGSKHPDVDPSRGCTPGRLLPLYFPWYVMATQQSCECCSSGPSHAGAEEGLSCYCPVDGVIDTISKKYSLQIVGLLGANGPMRYGDLEAALGATSTSLLANRLEELTEAGLIERRSFDEIPPRVEYSLTQRGRELETRIQPLLEWAAGAE